MKNEIHKSRNEQGSPPEGWVTCPDSAIEDMVQNHVNLQRRRLIRQVGIGSIAILTTVVTGSSIFRQMGFGGNRNLTPTIQIQLMACTDVQKLYPVFRDGGLECSKRHSIVAHLNKCRGCCHLLMIDPKQLKA